MRHLAAIAAALVLIGGALAVRSLAIDPDPPTDDPSRSGSGSDPMIVACSSDLGAVCEALDSTLDDGVEIRIVDPGAVADDLAAADWDGWVTTDVWADLARLEPQVGDRLVIGEPVAIGVLGLLATTRKQSTLEAACGSPVDLACAASSTAAGGGIGLGPVDSTDALLAAVAVVTAVVDASGGELDLDTGLGSRRVNDALDDLSASEDRSGHLGTYLSRPSAYAAAAGLGAAAALDRAAARDGFALAAVGPEQGAALVAVVRPGAPDETAEVLAGAWDDDAVSVALAGSGWDRDGADRPPPDRPEPAVIAQIRAIWNKVNP